MILLLMLLLPAFVIVSVLFVQIGLKRVDYAFLITMYVIFLWPAYLNVKLGALPNIGLDRIVLFLFFIIVLMKTGHSRLKLMGGERHLFVLYGLFSIWMLLAGLLSPFSKFASIYALVNWLLFGPFLAWCVISIFGAGDGAGRLIKHLFIISIIANCCGFIELLYGKPLFSAVAQAAGEDRSGFVEGFFRDEKTRLMSVFSNPLVYAQFLLVAICLSLINLNKRNLTLKWLGFANIIACYILLFETDSRAGLAISLILPVIFLGLKMWKNIHIAFFLRLGFLVSFCVAIFAVYWIYESYVGDARSLEELLIYGYVTSAEASSLARVLQWDLGLTAFLERPLWGYGEGHAGEAIQADIVLDNYYLSRLLSGGVIGLLLFLLPVIIVIRRALKVYVGAHNPRVGYVLAGVGCLLIFYLVLSINRLDTLLFILLGILVLEGRREQYLASRTTIDD